MSDEAEQHQQAGEPAAPHEESGRVLASGRRIDDDGWCPLLLIEEINGSWAIYCEGLPGVRLTRETMVSTAEQVLQRAAPEKIAEA